MTWFVYVIKSGVDGRLYKGMTQDVWSRLHTHNAGKVRSTKGYRPWQLVYTECCQDSIHARQREKFLKTYQGRHFLKSLGL